MHLPREHEVTEVGAEGGGDPAPVLQHGIGRVADAQAEVQRRVRTRRDAALPRGHHDLGVGPVEQRPRQNPQVPLLAELSGGHGGCGHGLRS